MQNYQFICIDIGSYGKNSDGGIFAHSKLGKALSDNLLNLPPDAPIEGAEQLGPVPYVVVGDEAFPLQKHVMRPFPGRGCPPDQQAYNMRLSRARRIVENAFGILAARWRVFHSKIAAQPDLARSIVKATVCLHNMLQRSSTPAEVTRLVRETQETRSMENLQGAGNRASKDAAHIQNLFKEYFVDIAPLPWQDAHIKPWKFLNIGYLQTHVITVCCITVRFKFRISSRTTLITWWFLIVLAGVLGVQLQVGVRSGKEMCIIWTPDIHSDC